MEYIKKILYKDVYHVYNHRGNVIVAKGNIVMNEYNSIVFMKENGGLNYNHSYALMNKHHKLIDPLTLNKNSHVWCQTEEDVEKAIELIMNRKLEYIKELEEAANKVKNRYVKVIHK